MPAPRPALPSPAASPWAPLVVALGTGLLFFLRFGYGYAASDQDEFLPLLFQHLDPTLYPTDPFVQGQLEGSGVRRWFVGLLYVPALVLPVPVVVLLAYAAAVTGIATAVYRLGERLTGDALAAAAAVVGVIVFTPQWTLGGNDLVHSMLAPSMGAWALALWGLVLALERRRIPGALLLAAATYLQALVGLQVAGLATLAVGAEQGTRRGAVLAGTYALAAGLALGPLVLGQAAGAPSAAAGEPSLFYLMAVFRNPHHYLPLAFSARSVVRFGLLAVLGGAALVHLHRRGALRHPAAVAILLGGVVGLGLVGFVGAGLADSLFFAKLQLFKPTVLAKTLFVIGLAGWAARYLPGRVRAAALAPLRQPGWTALVLGVAWAAVLAAAVPAGGPLRGLLPALHPPDHDLAAVEAWARAETPASALFAVPPSVSTFRSRARRGVAVNFKAFPFEPPAVRAWYARLQAFAPLPRVSERDRDRAAALDAAYAALPPDALRSAADAHGVRYVVRTAPLDAPGFAPAFSSGGWYVYRVAGAP